MDFRHCDTSRPDGLYVEWTRELRPDPLSSPEEYLFQDPSYEEADRQRLHDFLSGDWHMVSVHAKAEILAVQGGVGTIYSLSSAGLYAVESDSSEEHFAQIFDEEKTALMDHLKMFGEIQ